MSMRKAFAVVIVLASLNSFGYAQASPEVQHLAAVLVKNFETVTFTKVDFLADSESAHHSRYIESENSMRLPFILLLGGLQQMGPDAISAFEDNFGEVLSGAKDFAAPKGLGLTRAHTCYVAIAKAGVRPNMEPVFTKAGTTTISGAKVWTWDVPPDESAPATVNHFYAVQFDNEFLLANDRSAIEVVLAALSSGPSGSPTMADWRIISAHPYWSYRTLNSKTAAEAGLGSDVTSIMLYTELADQGKGEVTVKLTTSASKVTPQIFSNTHKKAEFVYERPGVWKTALPLDKGIQQDELVAKVFASLGFGLYL